ncbi:methionine synthase [Bdellovibrionota bacterium FG-2]
MTRKLSDIKTTLKTRVLVLDGAMGTAIQNHNLTEADFGGPDKDGCNEYLVITRPEVITKIHEMYFKAGADIAESNTFGGTPLVLDEYGLGHRAHEINLKAAQLARQAADRYSTPERPRFVAGSMGPTTKAISVTGGISFEDLQQNFHEQACALIEGGVDYLLLETCQDTRNIKAALLGIDRAFEKMGITLPIAVSGTVEPTGTMLAGQGVEALLTSLSHRELLYIGVNCATGPEFMTDHVRTLARLSPFAVACVPNAGLPDEDGCYLETPEMVAQIVSRFTDKGWVNLLGGCCGTTPAHIKALALVAAKASPRSFSGAPSGASSGTTGLPVSALSGIDYLEITDEIRPVIVGERTNVIGSKKFKTLICEGKFDEASEIARSQVRNGAQIVDICLANPDRDELTDMRSFLEIAAKKIRAPWMIDSTDSKVLELALGYSQGKAIINSVNLEDGEERMAQVAGLARRYGAALVVGTIDDDAQQGMGVSRARKLAIAERSHTLLTQKYGLPENDIYFDPLVFPCATGDVQYVGSAVETIEGLRLIKARFPKVKTVLGISNVSFGLPAAGREVLNSVFLYHCVQAGLDLAIVNAEKLVRYANISEEERKLSEDLLYNRCAGLGAQAGVQIGPDPVAAFAAHFREKKIVEKVQKEKLPLDQRLSRYILEGSKDGLVDDLNLALKGEEAMKPLEIINGPLMRGMDQVGKLFNANQLIVAEVLQSAEVMKAAVNHLEQFMEKAQSASRGRILLATVKGDVHDIGKNLVEIILSNNGFEVINLGIKIPPEQLIAAAREHSPDMIGLSGLLVKSAQQMVLTAEDLSKAGISIPVVVGGAALSSNFVDRQIARAYTTGTVAYASDAMNGLDLAKTIVDPVKFEAFRMELAERRAKKAAETPAKVAAPASPMRRSTQIQTLESFPSPPDLDRHVIKNTPYEHIWKYVNPLMLYGRHLGIKGGLVRQLAKALNDPKLGTQLEESEPKAVAIWNTVQEVRFTYRETEVLQSSAVYQFYRASSEGNSLVLWQGNSETARFTFPRQNQIDGLCLSDYVAESPSACDTVALYTVSVGRGIRELAEQFKNRGDYLKSHILQALALESAEAYAELLHSQIRKMWGYPDPEDITMMERFQAKYRGKRYSFGYPACPNLEDQAILWKLLRPQEIGIQLTEGFMMDPESSVSAIAFHHPSATYFSVGGASEDNRG